MTTFQNIFVDNIIIQRKEDGIICESQYNMSFIFSESGNVRKGVWFGLQGLIA